jgi:NADPH2:quinone reductase
LHRLEIGQAEEGAGLCRGAIDIDGDLHQKALQSVLARARLGADPRTAIIGHAPREGIPDLANLRVGHWKAGGRRGKSWVFHVKHHRGEMKMVHALRIHDYGGPDSLRWDEIGLGDPGPGEVRLRQTAIGVNYIDTYHRTGLYKLPSLPAVLGVEGAGVVEAVGEAVTSVKPGDRVAYAGPLGGYAESRLIAADRLVAVPDGIADDQAAALMLQGMTAEFLLRRAYRVEPGDTILVQAAAGGVGLLLCQWASRLGATVIGTVSTEEKAATARAHGAYHVILYSRENFVERVRALTGGAGVAVVYDGVGQTTFLGSLDCLRPRGMMVSFGQASGPIAPLDVGLLGAKGSLYLTRPSLFAYIAKREELVAAAAAVFEAVQQGALKIEINQRFPLRDGAAAHRALEARTTTGATVLIP